jgi:hypothetical protein
MTLSKLQTLCIKHISQRQINSQHSRGATRVLTFITQIHLELLINSTIKSHNILFYSLSKLSQKILTTRNFNTDGECAEKKQHSFPMERIENKCKHITSRHVCTNGSEETSVVNKKQ